MLKRGDVGPAVQEWQRIVGVTPDGIFGGQTEAATRAWQAQRGLEPDGIVADLVLRAAGLATSDEELTLGIDISRLQGAVDWARVRGAGVVFVVVKVSEGESYLDPRRLEYLRGARSEGIETGVYHFTRLSGDAERQAELVWRGLGDTMPDIGIVADVETMPTGLSATQAVERWARFDEAVSRYDSRGTIAYSYASFLANLRGALTANTEAAQRVRSTPLWLAHYLWRSDGPPPRNVRPARPPGWRRVDMWQCNGGGTPELNGPPIPGIGQPCDRNYYFGSRDQLRASWGGLPPLDAVPWWDRQPIVRPDVPLGRPALDGEP